MRWANPSREGLSVPCSLARGFLRHRMSSQAPPKAHLHTRPKQHCSLVCIRATWLSHSGPRLTCLSSGHLKRGCSEQKCAECKIHAT